MKYMTNTDTFSRELKRLALGVAILATACSGGDDDDETPAGPTQVTIDASSRTAFAYFSMSTNAEVSVADPQASTDWDIAFRRFGAKLNGGVAGAGDVSGYNLGNNAQATSDQVVALTAADADAAFEAVTEANIDEANFAVDSLIPDPGATWFAFSPMAGTVVANPSAVWQVKEADGGFAIFRVAELMMAGMQPVSATIEYRHQDAGGTLGQMGSITIDFSMGPGNVDFSTGTTVAPAGCDWDLSITPMLSMNFNTDCDAGSFPMDASVDFDAVTNADDAPEYGPFLAVISGAIPSSVEDASAAFWYNIQDQNRLWPTLNIFLVKSGTAVYKLQILDYYDDNDTSGFPTIRYERLR